MAKVTPKGSTTIPAAVRERFRIEAGQSLLFLEKDGELVVRKA